MSGLLPPTDGPDHQDLSTETHLADPGPEMITIKGLLNNRIVLALMLAALAVMLLVFGIEMLGNSIASGFGALALFATASIALLFSARALVSRTELCDNEVRLHYITRTLVLPRSTLIGIVRRRWLGSEVLALQLPGGRSARLPLLTQPEGVLPLKEQEDVLRAYLADQTRGRGDNQHLSTETHLAALSLEVTTIKGVMGRRILTSLVFGVLSAGLLINVFVIHEALDLNKFGMRVQYVTSLITWPLLGRSFASRTELYDDEVRLYYIIRSRVLPRSTLIGIVHSRWLRWDVLALQMVDAQTIRLPFMTQPVEASRLKEQEDVLRAYLAESTDK